MTYPKYHKIMSVFDRDPDNNHKTFLMGQWAEDSFGYLSENPWAATEKIDGTNMRLHVGDTGPEAPWWKIGGRTDNSQVPVPLMEHLDGIGHRTKGTDLGGLTLYGEGYGAGIQKGGGYRDNMGFILFDVMVTETGTFLQRDDVADIALKLDIPVVAAVWVGSLTEAVDWYLNPDNRISSNIREEEAEGWVLRPWTELRDRMGHRVITKMKVKDFPERRAS